MKIVTKVRRWQEHAAVIMINKFIQKLFCKDSRHIHLMKDEEKLQNQLQLEIIAKTRELRMEEIQRIYCKRHV